MLKELITRMESHLQSFEKLEFLRRINARMDPFKKEIRNLIGGKNEYFEKFFS